MNQEVFANFSQALELQPHGTVHTAIGGDISTMKSPIDALFYLHHSFVDGVYMEWQLQSPSFRLTHLTNSSDKDPALFKKLPYFNTTVLEAIGQVVGGARIVYSPYSKGGSFFQQNNSAPKSKNPLHRRAMGNPVNQNASNNTINVSKSNNSTNMNDNIDVSKSDLSTIGDSELDGSLHNVNPELNSTTSIQVYSNKTDSVKLCNQTNANISDCAYTANQLFGLIEPAPLPLKYIKMFFLDEKTVRQEEKNIKDFYDKLNKVNMYYQSPSALINQPSFSDLLKKHNHTINLVVKNKLVKVNINKDGIQHGKDLSKVISSKLMNVGLVEKMKSNQIAATFVDLFGKGTFEKIKNTYNFPTNIPLPTPEKDDDCYCDN